MRLTFIGAAHEVTGSCHLIEACGKKVLVDCGMEQGSDIFENKGLPIPAGEIDYVLLTHAHIDHSGKLPKLVKDGFSGKIYTTRATHDLCYIMLRDSAHIQEYEAAWHNRKAKRGGNDLYEPLYTMADAEKAISLLTPLEYGEKDKIADGIEVRFVDVGHLLGSAAIEIWLNEDGISKKIVFSGDVGNTNQPIIKDPTPISEADYLVIESTYGDRIHSEHTPDYVGEFTRILRDTFKRGGNVVIPSFAVGRTQELLYFIREIKEKKLLPEYQSFPVYVDSPLAIEATRVFRENYSDYDDDAMALIKNGVNPLIFDGLHTSVSSDESIAINTDMTPKVIISASGMCDAGRIRHHLKHNLWRKDSTVCFVGYQAGGTLGRKLMDGSKEVKIFGETIVVNAAIEVLEGISGHADKNGLLNWISGFTTKPSKIFVVHGEDSVTEEFAKTITDTFGIPAFAPYPDGCADLSNGEVLFSGNAIRIVKPGNEPAKDAHSGQVHEAIIHTSQVHDGQFFDSMGNVLNTAKDYESKAYLRVLNALKSLEEVVNKSKGLPNKELAKIENKIENLTKELVAKKESKH
ncbi:MAG: MBL fold metallo-hydrolase [Lachnospiraceae bacterium]|jgi:metallo-beta-lactamase family protein|nr:MBL fold metallo-hydrolase [Lachnospiraceae bacterium]